MSPGALRTRCCSGAPNQRRQRRTPLAAANERRHGVSFEEAQTVFHDERALLIDDPDHSGEEDRFVLLGITNKLRVLVVVHAYRANDEVI